MEHQEQRDSNSSSDTKGPSSTGRPAKRRRVWRMVLYVLAVIFILIAAAPMIVSSGPGTGIIEDVINKKTSERIELGDLSVGWLSPCQLSGIEVKDKDGRSVATIKQVYVCKGILRQIKRGNNWQIAVDGCDAVVYVAEPNKEKKKKDKESEKKQSEDQQSPIAALGILNGKIDISHTNVQLKRFDGATYDIKGIGASISLNALQSISCALEMKLHDGEKVNLSGLLEYVVRDKQLVADQTQVHVIAETEPIHLERITSFIDEKQVLQGNMKLMLQASYTPEQIDSVFECKLDGLQSPATDRASIQPISFGLTGDVAMKGEMAVCRAAIEGDFGKMISHVELADCEQFKETDFNVVLGAILAGGDVELPEITVESSGRFDLAAIAGAVPGLLQLKPGLAIESGELVVKTVQVKGGKRPELVGGIELKDLQAKRGAEILRYEPILVDVDLVCEPGKGLVVRDGKLQSEFAFASASGTLSAMQVKFTGDLDRLNSRLGELFEWGDRDLAGQIAGQVQVARVDPEHLSMTADVQAQKVRYQEGGRKFSMDQASVHHEGQVVLADNRVSKVVVSGSEVVIDQAVRLKGAGWYDVQAGGFAGQVTDVDVDLGWVSELQNGLQDHQANGIKIEGQLQQAGVEFSRAGGDQPIVCSGSGTISNLLEDGKGIAAAGEPILWQWQGLNLQLDGGDVSLAGAVVESGAGKVSVKDVQAHWKDSVLAKGQASVSADLQKVGDLVRQWDSSSDFPVMQGQLNWSGQCQSMQSDIVVEGQGSIDHMEMGTGKDRFRERKMMFVHDVVLDSKNQDVRVRKVQVNSESGVFGVTADGNVKDYAKTCVLDFSGHYTSSLDAVTLLLHQFKPDTATTVSMSGVSQSDFSVKGPLRKVKTEPAAGEAAYITSYESLTGQCGFGWESAKIYGTNFAKADFPVTLQDGQVIIPETVVAADEGKVRLGGLIDLRKSPPELIITKETQLLENFAVNPEVADQVLSRVNPIFGGLAKTEGSISLLVKGLAAPLGDAIKTGGSGRGRIELSKMKIQPQGVLRELLQLGGVSGDQFQTMQSRGLDFRIDKGRVHYNNFVVAFGQEFDMRFSGSVGFDDQVDLNLSVPISESLLRRFGVGGDAAEYARLLAGGRVENIKIVGARQSPQLDLSKVDLRPVIQKAAERLLNERASEALKKILQPKSDSPVDQKPQVQPPADQKPQVDAPPQEKKKRRPEDEALDILLDILKPQGPKQEKP